MRKVSLLCAVVLLSSVAAASQDSVPTLVGPTPAAAAPASPQGPNDADLTDWELSVGYQFNRFNMPAVKGVPAFQVNDSGLNSSLTRFITHSVGLEAAVAAGFRLRLRRAPVITSARVVVRGRRLALGPSGPRPHRAVGAWCGWNGTLSLQPNRHRLQQQYHPRIRRRRRGRLPDLNPRTLPIRTSGQITSVRTCFLPIRPTGRSLRESFSASSASLAS